MFNHTSKRLWQLSNQYGNSTEDLLQKVEDGYAKCATVPTWLNLIKELNKEKISFDVYLDKAENVYRDHLKQESWTYKVSETTVIKNAHPTPADQ